jgi:carbamate kinase
MSKLAVLAFGGNALLRGNQLGTIEEQDKNAYDTCKNLLKLISNGYNIVITHGNGPQVGNILLRNEAGYNVFKIPKMPLDICVADSQGGIGYMIERQMRNILAEYGIDKHVVTIVTPVLVDINDWAFENPTKPVGQFYLKEEADLLSCANKWTFREDPRKRGWRRVVASPLPVEVMNKDIIRQLALSGSIIIAAGGGGVPVYYDQSGKLCGAEAVIDKDLASALLAKEIGADEFFILTDVAKVSVNFNTPEQRDLDCISVTEARQYLAGGEFASGSMGPKITAAINFVESSKHDAVITEATELNNGLCGTRIVKEIKETA